MPLQATSGAASYDAFGGGVAAVPNYIEDVFSTYLYTGNGSTQTITNGIDLAGEGGLIWTKHRTLTSTNHILTDSVSGLNYFLRSNQTNNATSFTGNGLIAPVFNSNGFTTSDYSDAGAQSGYGFVTWTFRKQPKFFDVVTYTGDGTAGRTVAHNLGSVPGCIIVKSLTDATDWTVYHTSTGNTKGLYLNTTGAAVTSASFWNDTTPTSTVFTLGGASRVNFNGGQFVAYIFAHDAGGFGLTGTDNVISCGSYTGNGSTAGPVINLGWEPQWVLIKRTNTTGSWFIFDNMRGFSSTSEVNRTLIPNADSPEPAASTAYDVYPTSTGFQPNTVSTSFNASGSTYIYIAIRRGPMKVPTSGTSVFAPTTYTGTGSARSVTGLGFPPDMVMLDSKSFANNFTYDKLRGPNIRLFTNDTAAEVNDANRLTSFDQNGYSLGNLNPNESGIGYANWNFQRAPSFFDEVCYTGTGVVGRAVLHNLGVAPELLIVKERSGVGNWEVIAKDALGGLVFYQMNSTQAGLASRDGHLCFPTATFVPPTATQFVVGADDDVNGSGSTYVAYLFATCAGVSKVGSYTGSDSDLNIDCGFTSGARFVMIKRTDASSDWYVWDSARGIVSGNDPRLSLNTTAAEVTDMNMINPYSAGFSIPAGGPNTGAGATFIYLAIA